MIDIWRVLQQWLSEDNLPPSSSLFTGPYLPYLAKRDLENLWNTPNLLHPQYLAQTLQLGLIAAQAGWSIQSCDNWHTEAIKRYKDRAARRRIALFHELWRAILSEPSWLDKESLYGQSVLQLLQGIAQQELQAYYQPVIDMHTGIIRSAEALIRWHTPESVILPGKFLPLATSSQLLGLIDALVWSQVLEDLPRLIKIQPTFSISINAGQTPLQQPAWPPFLEKWRQQSGLAPNTVTVEVLESLIANSSLRNTLGLLVQHGFHIALDDFGIRTAMDLLGDVSVHTMKIDRSLIVSGTTNSRVGIIVQGLVQMAHDLQLETVAEGVETVEQWDACERWHVDAIQGFLLGRPMPRHAFLSYLKHGAQTLPHTTSVS